MANKKYLHEIIRANADKPLPYDVVLIPYSGRPRVYAVMYKCDLFAVLEDVEGNSLIVASDYEQLADEMIADDDQYQLVVSGNTNTPAVAPRTAKVAIYAFQKGNLWYQSAVYYKDDAHFMQLNPATPEFKRVVQSEIEVSV